MVHVTSLNVFSAFEGTLYDLGFTSNTELNDLRKITCLRKSEVLLKEFQFVILLKIDGAWHKLSALLLYQ